MPSAQKRKRQRQRQRQRDFSVEITPFSRERLDSYRKHTPEPKEVDGPVSKKLRTELTVDEREESPMPEVPQGRLRSDSPEEEPEREKEPLMVISSPEPMPSEEEESDYEMEEEEKSGDEEESEEDEEKEGKIDKGKGKAVDTADKPTKTAKKEPKPAGVGRYTYDQVGDGMSTPKFPMSAAFKSFKDEYRQLIAPVNDPTKPLPILVFPPREGVYNRLGIQFDYQFKDIRRLIDSSGTISEDSWGRVARALDIIAFKGDLRFGYYSFHPSIMLLIKRIAFDYRPPLNGLTSFYPSSRDPTEAFHYENENEGRARNIAAIIWSRWYLNIFDPHPSNVPMYPTPSYYPSGSIFPNRAALLKTNLHRSQQGGIAGNQATGAVSVVMSKSSYDDLDRGDTLWYSGTESKDGINASANTNLLDEAHRRGTKLRVFRTKECGWMAPAWGIRYDGLYRITNRQGDRGNYIYKLDRCQGQWPILYPTPQYMALLPGAVKQQEKKEEQQRRREEEERKRKEDWERKKREGLVQVRGSGTQTQTKTQTQTQTGNGGQTGNQRGTLTVKSNQTVKVVQPKPMMKPFWQK